MNENKRISKKLIALLVAVMLLIGCVAGGTLAWLMTKTEPVVNTFVAGDIDITLTEPSFVTDDKTAAGKDARKAIPGEVIPKDPTVTVLANSEKCYVRIFMLSWWDKKTDGFFQGDEGQDWFNFNDDESGYNPYWIGTYAKFDNTSDQVLGNVIEFTYSEAVEFSTVDQPLTPLFTQITVPTHLTGEKLASLNNITHTFIAQAVQADGFDTAAKAFAAAGYPEIVAERLALHGVTTGSD